MVFCAGMVLADFGKDNSISEMRSFNSAAHGLTVYYLCGDATWATTHKSSALQYVLAVLKYNAAATPAQKFVGFMYDVEPWSLPSWPGSGTINGWLQILADAHRTIKSSATMTWWLDDPKYADCGNSAIDNIDNAFIMDYTVNTTNFQSFPSDEISYASSKGKGVWVAVETNSPAGAITSYGHGNAPMESCLNTTLPAIDRYAAYRGYGIDDYLGYVEM